MRGWRPSCAANSVTASRARVTAGPAPASFAYTPEMIRIRPAWRPNTFSSESEISPTVALARAAAIARASRLSSCDLDVPSAVAAAAFVSAVNAESTARWSRSSRSRRSLSSCWARTPALSTRRTSISLSELSDPVTNLLTPMTGWRPESMRAWVRAAASSTRSLGMPASIACAIPPAFSTSVMCAHARRTRS